MAGVAGPNYGAMYRRLNPIQTTRYTNGVRNDIISKLPMEDQNAIRNPGAPGIGGYATPPSSNDSGSSGAAGPSYLGYIPGAGMYLEEERRALLAWQQAQARVTSEYQGALNKYGLTGDINNGKVSGVHIDPNSHYGLIQQMFHNQADNLDSLREDAQQRGLGGIGLGAQGVSNYRWQMGADSAGLNQNFMDNVNQIGQEYAQGQADYNNALWTAEQQAAQTALQGGYFNPADIGSIKDYLKKLFGKSYQGVLG